MNAKARRLEINLMTLGTGVILFGVWSFIKLALTFLIYKEDFGVIGSDENMAIAMIFIWALFVLAFLIYFYIGKSARSEGKGKHKTIFYLIVTGAVILLGVASIVLEVIAVIPTPELYFSTGVSLIIDATSLVILIEVMINAISLRKLRKKEATA